MIPTTPAATVRALVVAHYHRQGRIRSDTLELLKASQQYFSRTILVSTNLDSGELAKIPAAVQCCVRENVGYDFYSYRHGLEQLLKSPPLFASLTELWFLNSSFLCVDSHRLLDRLVRDGRHFDDCYGLVKSHQFGEHLQSYLLVIRRQVFSNPVVMSWWASMVPVSDRSRVIRLYEIGLSQLLLGLGYKLNAVFDHLASPSEEIERLSHGSPERAAQLNRSMNPSHFHWWRLFEEFGVLKIEVIKANPFRLNLRPLAEAARRDQHLLDLIREGLAN